jgi:chromosome segregation ATPase
MDLHFLHPGHYKIDLHVHGELATEKILSKLDLFNTKIEKIMADLTKLEADVTAQATVIASAVTLLQGLKQKLDEAGTDKVKLAALSSSIESQTQSLSAAVVANTPSEEVPPTQ